MNLRLWKAHFLRMYFMENPCESCYFNINRKSDMRKLITFFLFIAAYAAKAQTSEATIGKLDVYSSLGLSFVDNDYDPASGNSIQTATGLELKLSRMSSIGLGLAFD